MNEKTEFVNIISDKSNYIKKTRNKLGYKQDYMAAELGISQSKYSLYEKFADYLHPRIFKKITKILDIDIDSLEEYIEAEMYEKHGKKKVDTLKNIAVNIIYEAIERGKEDMLTELDYANPLFRSIFLKERSKIEMERYFDGELKGIKLKETEERLEDDVELENTLNMSRRVNKNLNILFFKEKINRICIKNRLILKLKRYLAGFSILFMLLLGGNASYKIINKENLENSLYSKYYQPFKDNNDNGSFVLNSSILEEAKNKYKKGEFKNAFLLFKNLPPSLTLTTEQYFYSGLSLMELKDYDKAIQNFEIILSQDSPLEVVPHVQWYLALCYLKSNDKDKAKKIFKTIVDKKKYNHKKAARILKKL